MAPLGVLRQRFNFLISKSRNPKSSGRDLHVISFVSNGGGGEDQQHVTEIHSGFPNAIVPTRCLYKLYFLPLPQFSLANAVNAAFRNFHSSFIFISFLFKKKVTGWRHQVSSRDCWRVVVQRLFEIQTLCRQIGSEFLIPRTLRLRSADSTNPENVYDMLRIAPTCLYHCRVDFIIPQ